MKYTLNVDFKNMEKKDILIHLELMEAELREIAKLPSYSSKLLIREILGEEAS